MAKKPIIKGVADEHVTMLEVKVTRTGGWISVSVGSESSYMREVAGSEAKVLYEKIADVLRRKNL